jgi:hypothetical protein
MKFKRTLAVGALVVSTGAALSLTACGSSTPQPASSSRTAAAPASTSCSLISQWASNGGSATLNAVQVDLTQAEGDTNSNSLLALETTDGPALARDAATALADPMPGSTSYATAMGDYVQAGNDITAGDLTSATTQLNAANSLVDAATTAVKNCTR